MVKWAGNRGMDSTTPDPVSTGTTGELLERAQAGDPAALNLLFERHLPTLRRWAHGRLPRWARDIADTTDLVQETILETLKRLDRFEHRGDGALQAYLRQAVMNRIRNELRKQAIRGATLALDSGMQDQGTSPLEAAAAHEILDQYDTALQRLTPEEREAVVSRVEFDLSYAELADVLGKPSPDAARMAVVRALVRLAEEMNRAP